MNTSAWWTKTAPSSVPSVWRSSARRQTCWSISVCRWNRNRLCVVFVRWASLCSPRWPSITTRTATATTRWSAPSARKRTGLVLETSPRPRQLPTLSSPPLERRPVAVQRSVPRLLLRLRPQHQTGHISAQCAIRPSGICQSWPAMREYTLAKSHTNVTRVIKASASLHIWHTTSARTALSGRINVPCARRALSTALTSCGTCTLIQASTSSSAICVRCTLRSRRSSCTISASQKGRDLSAAVRVERASSARPTCGSTNAPTRRSGLSSARSARWASNSSMLSYATVALTKTRLIALSSVTSVIRASFSRPTCSTTSRFTGWRVCLSARPARSLSANRENCWGTNVAVKWRSPTSATCAAKVTKRIRRSSATRTLTARRSRWNAPCATSASCRPPSLFSTAATRLGRSRWNVPTVKSASGTRLSCSAIGESTPGRSLSSVPAATRASSSVSTWPSTRVCIRGRHSLSVCGAESVLLTSQLCRSTQSSTPPRVRVSPKLPASHELSCSSVLGSKCDIHPESSVCQPPLSHS